MEECAPDLACTWYCADYRFDSRIEVCEAAQKYGAPAPVFRVSGWLVHVCWRCYHVGAPLSSWQEPLYIVARLPWRCTPCMVGRTDAGRLVITAADLWQAPGTRPSHASVRRCLQIIWLHFGASHRRRTPVRPVGAALGPQCSFRKRGRRAQRTCCCTYCAIVFCQIGYG